LLVSATIGADATVTFRYMLTATDSSGHRRQADVSATLAEGAKMESGYLLLVGGVHMVRKKRVLRCFASFALFLLDFQTLVKTEIAGVPLWVSPTGCPFRQGDVCRSGDGFQSVHARLEAMHSILEQISILLGGCPGTVLP
jgi:hypothetical protein